MGGRNLCYCKDATFKKIIAKWPKSQAEEAWRERMQRRYASCNRARPEVQRRAAAKRAMADHQVWRYPDELPPGVVGFCAPMHPVTFLRWSRRISEGREPLKGAGLSLRQLDEFREFQERYGRRVTTSGWWCPAILWHISDPRSHASWRLMSGYGLMRYWEFSPSRRSRVWTAELTPVAQCACCGGWQPTSALRVIHFPGSLSKHYVRRANEDFGHILGRPVCTRCTAPLSQLVDQLTEVLRQHEATQKLNKEIGNVKRNPGTVRPAAAVRS